ncbi:metallophosphoesterase family protein [Neobacillus sp. Marseille-QA0830]
MNFPFILAGPILRRVEPTKVYIWLATSKNADITEEFFKVTENNPYEKLETVSECKTIQAGKNLFIHLIGIKPSSDPSFPLNTLIGYNLHFLRSKKSRDLARLFADQSLTYGDLQYPTFQIQADKLPSSFLYGSCRKLHGEGDDRLVKGDSILEEHAASLDSRPTALFLTGDQIYADNVAHPIIRVLSKLGKALLGTREPLEKVEPRLGKERSRSARSQINGRKEIIKDFCHFTTDNPENHLMELGEYAAMYLLSWSPALWKTAHQYGLFQTFEVADAENQIYYDSPFGVGLPGLDSLQKRKLKTQYNNQQQALVSFQQNLHKIRRLLANIPVYMIFDDHDITDDWNITASWKDQVSRSPLGRHVIANGLTAYWMFQGWGNDPDSFGEEFLEIMQSHFLSLKRRNKDSGYEKWVRTVWEFDSWHYIAPTSPEAVFLDTRTQREYKSHTKSTSTAPFKFENEAVPELVNQMSWNQVTKKLDASGWVSHTPLMVVSATPVYGMGLIESFLHNYVYPFRAIGIDVETTFDFEAWKYNGKGFTEFLKRAADWGASPCIILSGDVHFASEVKAQVTFHDGEQLSIHQVTSSPLKNRSFSGIWGMLMKAVITSNAAKRKNKQIHRICRPDYEIIHVEPEHSEPFIWKDQLAYQFIEEDSIMVTNNNLGLLVVSAEQIKNTVIT